MTERTKEIIDFKTRRHLAIADELQRISLSGEEAAECQRLMTKGWMDKSLMDCFEEEHGKEARYAADGFIKPISENWRNHHGN